MFKMVVLLDKMQLFGESLILLSEEVDLISEVLNGDFELVLSGSKTEFFLLKHAQFLLKHIFLVFNQLHTGLEL